MWDVGLLIICTLLVDESVSLSVDESAPLSAFAVAVRGGGEKTVLGRDKSAPLLESDDSTPLLESTSLFEPDSDTGRA